MALDKIIIPNKVTPLIRLIYFQDENGTKMKISKDKLEMKLAEVGAVYGNKAKQRLAERMGITPQNVSLYLRKAKLCEDFDPSLVGRMAKAFSELLHEPLDIAGLTDAERVTEQSMEVAR